MRKKFSLILSALAIWFSTSSAMEVEWIEAKDELPEVGELVLFVNNAHRTRAGWIIASSQECNFIYFYDVESREWALAKYWMRRPEPPKD